MGVLKDHPYGINLVDKKGYSFFLSFKVQNKSADQKLIKVHVKWPIMKLKHVHSLRPEQNATLEQDIIWFCCWPFTSKGDKNSTYHGTHIAINIEMWIITTRVR